MLLVLMLLYYCLCFFLIDLNSTENVIMFRKVFTDFLLHIGFLLLTGYLPVKRPYFSSVYIFFVCFFSCELVAFVGQITKVGCKLT